jgi:hypothetical protein
MSEKYSNKRYDDLKKETERNQELRARIAELEAALETKARQLHDYTSHPGMYEHCVICKETRKLLAKGKTS